ncbi:hypothetical protein JW979_09675, partial [bacterium]|nr:hypothetical protein [candidate division CSSED10-310 bacterium]
MAATQDNIIERMYVKGTLEVVSPLIVGSGEDELADIQLIRDWNGTPFIPGTAIAGAARHYLDEMCASENEVEKSLVNILFGKKAKKDDDTTQSLITFYDARPNGNIHENLTFRDGVELSYTTKAAKDGAKYDYEVIERGQQFEFRLEVTFRACHQKKDGMKKIVFAVLNALKHQKIAFGAKTRRGFGVLRLQNDKLLTLEMTNPEHVAQWLKFIWDDATFLDVPAIPESPMYCTVATEITTTFDIPYSILIRHYSSDPQDPDTSHLTSKGQSVIPGTSWNGALRHAIHHILRDLNQPETVIETITNQLFGYVSETQKEARVSRILVHESLIDGGEQLAYTRNKVDRFTGGVVNSVLFDEQPHYGGKVELCITIKNAQDWEKGLLALTLKDIGHGIQPVGGAANIGR